MYEIFESKCDNFKIQQKYNNLDNYKIEEINGGGDTVGYFLHLTGCIFPQRLLSLKNR